MRRNRPNSITCLRTHLLLAGALAFLSGTPAVAQDADPAAAPAVDEAAESAAEPVATGDAPLVGEGTAAALSAVGPLAPEDDEAEQEEEAVVMIEAQPQPLYDAAEISRVPAELAPQLEAVNAAIAQLAEVVRSTQDATALRTAAKTAATDIQKIRRSLQFYGIRVEEQGGKLVNVLDRSIGLEAASALGVVIGDALAIERGLQYCLELFPKTCHQRLRGDLAQLSKFDASRDLELPEGRKRIASTETLGLGTLVVAYLPDPKAPVASKPAPTGDDELDAKRRNEASEAYQEAMQDFLKYRVQVQQSRLPHTMVNHALATGDLIDVVTLERDFVNKQGKKEKIVRDATKRLRGPDDPIDDVTTEDLWAFIVKLDKDDEAFRQSLAGTSAATSTE